MGLPQKILAVDGWIARCAGDGGEVDIHLGLVGPQPPGTWLLTFLGDARAVLDEETALRILRARQAMEHVRNGGTDVHAWFADLADREPALPEHLQPTYPVREVPHG